MQNSMGIFTFFGFDLKYLFQAYVVQKLKIVCSNWNLINSNWTNSNMQNSMVGFIASVLDWKYPFWASLVQKMKIVSFSWNLVLILTQIWRIQWWCSLFLINLFRKIKIVCWNWNLEPRLIRISRIRMLFSFYSLLDWECPFWVNFVQKFKIVGFKLKFST